jgi:hypothetical protein
MKLENIIEKINEIDECKLKNKNTIYSLSTVWTTKKTGGVYKAYIIY